MNGCSWSLRAAVILSLGLCARPAAAFDPALSGALVLHFNHMGEPPNDDDFYCCYSGALTLTLPAVLDITTVGPGTFNWSDEANWTTFPLDLTGLSISQTGNGSYTFEVNNGDANLNVLQSSGPTEYSVNTRVTFPFVYNGIGPTVISNTVDTRYNVTLPAGAHLNHDQNARLQNLTINAGASMTGSSYTIRDNLTNHGSGNFNVLVEGNFINDAVAAGGNVANAIYLQIEGQLVNTGELQITQLLETLAATSNAGTIKQTGSFYPQAAFANNGTFEFSGGGLLGSGVVTNYGTFDWSGGYIAGTVVNASNSFTISGPNSRTLDGTLTNGGTITQSGGHHLFMSNGGILNNQGSGLYDIIDDSTLYDGFALGTINNAGTFRKSGGSGVSTVGPAINNTGTISVTSGVLRFYGGGTLDGGTMSFSGGGTVELSSGPFFVRGSNSASGNGALELATGGNATVTVANGDSASFENFTGGAKVANGDSASFENFTGGANLVLSGAPLGADAGGTLTLNLTGTSTVQLTGTPSTGGGRIGGAGTTINTGNFEWTRGSVVGNLTNTSANFTITGDAQRYVSGSLTNAGTMTQSGGSDVQINLMNTLTNQAGALFDIVDDSIFSSGFQGGFINNAGTFRKSGGSGISTIGPAFTNTGTLAIDSGRLWFVGADVLTLDESGTLAFKLSGIDEATDYGKVDVSHELVADGTLAVSLEPGFAPAAGDSFDLLDWASISGTFDSVTLPPLNAGIVWNATQLYTMGVLSVALAGDFNFDGKVDAADYVVWRKNGGTQAEFDTWRANFGQTADSGSGSAVGPPSQNAVPEPASLILLGLAMLWLALAIRRC